MKDLERFDVVIVGAGIAGTALAYFLSERGVTDVLVVERESQPAYHASGRSASSLVELDETPTIQQLKMIGGRFLRNPPEGFAENPLLDQTGVLLLFREPLWSGLREAAPIFREQGMGLELLETGEASARVEGMLLEDQFDGAALLTECGYLDVHEILSSYMANARRRGAQFRFNTEVVEILADRGACRGVATRSGRIEASRVVNASGAWVGVIAKAAGASPIRFTAFRRSIVMLPHPEGADTASWPMVWSEGHKFYFRHDPVGILFCPMEQEAMEPCDATSDDLAIAEGLDRLGQVAPGLVPRTLGRKWAGLRTFSPDCLPVVGEDPRLSGFYWLAGQGGCGIETSPAVSRIAADLIASGETEVFDASVLAPERFGEG